ncbi:hypothetical protein ACIBSV_46850 [Embleya sp. NPDC050154]|uniref:hypothetical protein n=1 Tax=Embleya sp. NPDC050154 TaxID=3363988 RepID=UPI0037AB153A
MSEREYVRDLDVIRHHCPIDVCTWHHDQSNAPGPMFARIDPATGVPDFTAAITAMVEARNAAAEAEVAKHAGTHTALEWLTEIARLRQQIHEQEVEQAQIGCGVRPHRYVDPPPLLEVDRRIPATLIITGLAD